ncbi:ornithine cyclodeaminase family protein [Phreatobacter sp.]|uniref:ornithine cyclodeaminase family protein n=1 Tax=Phreatobacter sp. TaxID=1966341 RepID=UPI003F723CC7
MRIVTAGEIAATLSYPALVEALADAFRADFTVPLRHHHPIPQAGGEPEAMLLLMPAWTPPGEGSYVGTKIVSVYPGNGTRSLPAIYGSYLLSNGQTGAPLAILDGTTLTVWRTACASALASRFLSRKDASHMVMVGAGALAPHLIQAHAAVRPIRQAAIWNRSRDKAHALVEGLQGLVPNVRLTVTTDLQAAVEEADIVSCATISAKPLIHGGWLKDGAHLDLVGGYTPAMREADDAAVTRASLFIDTRTGALKEAGDIVDPIRRGVVTEAAVKADLFELCRGRHAGRTSEQEVTLFKSVGTALEDLAAAMLVWRSLPV